MKLLFALFLLAAPSQPPEFQVVADLANYLSQGNGPGAMDSFDKNMPNYQTISNNVFAMVSQADVSCTIDPLEQKANVIEVDWFLKLNSKADQGPHGTEANDSKAYRRKNRQVLQNKGDRSAIDPRPA